VAGGGGVLALDGRSPSQRGSHAAGMALMAPNIVVLAGVLAPTLGFELHVRRVEEPYLRWAHSDADGDYAASVGRFVAGIGRLRR
jgi:protein-S-isoprenylcysteine O-methyltransferase Ste14